MLGGGSADPVVSAVLNAVGKRYLVEHQEADDGSQEYDLYSDGYIVQSGSFVPRNGGGTHTVTLPKAMSSENYLVVLQGARPGFSGEWYPDAGPGYVVNVKTTSFDASIPSSNNSEFLSSWIAQGYAA